MAQASLFVIVGWDVEMQDEGMVVLVDVDGAGKLRSGWSGWTDVMKKHADAHQETPKDGLYVEPPTRRSHGGGSDLDVRVLVGMRLRRSG